MAKYASQESRLENPEDAPDATRRLDAVCDRLLVLWRAPGDGTSIRIGDLRRKPPGFTFAYVDDLQHAFDRRFRLLTEFPHHRRRDDPYRSPRLFPTFAERIPSPKRPDYRAILESWGAEHTDDPLAILGLSGGIQATDRLELAEYRPVDDDLSDPLQFRIVGMKYQPAHVNLKVGDRLDLLREPRNIHQPDAMLVLAHNAIKVGYVPRQYSRMIARILGRGRPLGAVVIRELNVPADAGRWVVQVSST